MLRARQTIKELLRILPIDERPKILIAPALSRFFFPGQQENPRINPRSKDHSIPVVETFSEFKHRVDMFYKNVVRSNKKKGLNCWYITHTMVLKRISKMKNIEIPKYIPFNYVLAIQ
jgi:broad specificity phosphatase PhoE